MGKKRRRDQNGNGRSEIAVRPNSIPEYFQDLFYNGILNNPSDFVVPPLNPPNFGYQRPELLYKSPLITGQILFDDPFYNVPPPPPLGKADPTYPEWLEAVKAVEQRAEICKPGEETPECGKARTAHFDAARNYATALDKYWGLNRFQEEDKNAKQGTQPPNIGATTASKSPARQSALPGSPTPTPTPTTQNTSTNSTPPRSQRRKKTRT